jgi:16S rRNA (guanine527-N7)-methyltransferase
MLEVNAKKLLIEGLNFTTLDMNKLELFRKYLIEYNKKYNLISKSTEKMIWSRHILDSAQLIKYFDTNLSAKLSDLGSGAGFPGLIIALYNKNPKFHVKLYEKSPIKRDFLTMMRKKLSLDFTIEENIYKESISVDIIVARAFKKIDKIIDISREIVKKPHKIIVLKGRNAQNEIKNVSLASNYSYKLEKSITDNDSKLIIINVR